MSASALRYDVRRPLRHQRLDPSIPRAPVEAQIVDQTVGETAELLPMQSTFDAVRAWAQLIRDFGLIVGVPGIVGIVLFLYRQQIKTLVGHVELLQEFRYDRALSVIEAQKKIHEMERLELEEKIGQLSQIGSRKDDELRTLKASLDRVTASIDVLDREQKEVARRLVANLWKDDRWTDIGEHPTPAEKELYFEQLWREADDMSYRDYESVSVREEQRVRIERALVQATRTATEKGYGAEWASWIARKRG